MTSKTPMLDKARKEELTSSEIQAALRELRALGLDVDPLYAELRTDTYHDCVVSFGSRRHSADTIEDALLMWRDDIDLELAQEEDPGTELAVRFGCTCTARPARATDVEPPDVMIDPMCPIHGRDET